MSDIDSMLLPDLKKLASSLGVKSTGLRKAELAAAVKATQAGQGKGARRPSGTEAALPLEASAPTAEATAVERPRRQRSAQASSTPQTSGARDEQRASQPVTSPAATETQERSDATAGGDDVASRLEALAAEGPRRNRNRNRNNDANEQRSTASAPASTDESRTASSAGANTHNASRSAENPYDDDSQGGRRNRRRRNRDRNNRRSGGSGGRNAGLDKLDVEPTVNDDDVLTEVSGILDVLDNYAFVRTSGYLPGNNDAYVALSMVKKWGLRKGDIVTGAMRAHREGERQKFSPLVRIDTINAADPALAKDRPEFNKLTPLYPQDRLRLETTPTNMTGRIIDLVAPIGKGQRGLIVSPPKAGKTMVMQSIANAIVANNPEVHLMVVLVDERPEEVTDFQRSVKGEVIASTFDRPADDHTTVAELAIERAKRLVEQGHDVVILLDGITRLSRAYNLAAPASGRILSGGVDSAALYPPKKFFGAARNVENGGSLTILATALVETGSKMDDVIFEEFKGTGNMELRLRREMADKRIFPAIDAVASGTRREEQLMTREELAIMWKLRRVLSGLEDQAALEMLINRLRKTQTNLEFLHVISRTTPSAE
ncbi:transcription termination factor Rho [Propioniciclava flava]